MAVYPDFKIENFEDKKIKPVSKSSYDGGYTQRVAKFTRTLSQFTFSHENLSQIEKETLEAFFNQNQGLSFTFVHPLNSETFEVSFDSDDVSFSYDKIFQCYSTKIALMEV